METDCREAQWLSAEGTFSVTRWVSSLPMRQSLGLLDKLTAGLVGPGDGGDWLGVWVSLDFVPVHEPVGHVVAHVPRVDCRGGDGRDIVGGGMLVEGGDRVVGGVLVEGGEREGGEENEREEGKESGDGRHRVVAAWVWWRVVG